MADPTRYKILAFLGITLFAALILSAGLGSLTFKPGEPFVGGEATSQAPEQMVIPKVSANGGQILPFIQGAAAFLFIVLLFFLMINLISAVGYKQILKSAVALAISLAILVILPRIHVPELRPIEVEPVPTAEAPIFEYPTTPLGDPPDSLIWFVVIVIGAAAVGFVLWLALRRSKPGQVNRFLQEAEEAMSALQNGVDLRNVIVRCYVQMCQALQEERGIERGITVTPHEFIELLAARGIPEGSVRILTGLFERVRYGSQVMSAQDEQDAVESLSAIVAACREGAVST